MIVVTGKKKKKTNQPTSRHFAEESGDQNLFALLAFGFTSQ